MTGTEMGDWHWVWDSDLWSLKGGSNIDNYQLTARKAAMQCVRSFASSPECWHQTLPLGGHVRELKKDLCFFFLPQEISNLCSPCVWQRNVKWGKHNSHNNNPSRLIERNIDKRTDEQCKTVIWPFKWLWQFKVRANYRLSQIKS